MVESAEMVGKKLKPMQSYKNSPKIKKDIAEYRRAGRTAKDYYDENLLLFDQMVRGREVTDLTLLNLWHLSIR